MITYIETGKRSPTLKTIIKLCNAIGISPAKLFDIAVLDHLIVTSESFYSFSDNGDI